ncbi:DNA replication ATP-dependent helicase/nuclease [Aphelenchoides besseyi]|nr:DNA replication ATP-dependent helicase/nuclease [Aphelenchoides besseyi]
MFTKRIINLIIFAVLELTSKSWIRIAILNSPTLMTNTDEACRLCSLLIERKPPKFSSEIKLPESVERFLADLDAPRRATVDHCIAADDYAIIQGLPGAGSKKDNDCCFGCIVSQNEETRFVGFSHTHSAVDNAMMKLKGSVPDFQILRVGAEKSLHPDVMDYGLDARIEKISGMSRLILHKKWYI